MNILKKGYVTASVNYRLSSNQLNFVLSQEEQYLTVWNSVADVRLLLDILEKIILTEIIIE